MRGEALKEAGMALVLANTDPRWRSAYQRLAAEWFADMPRGTVFTGEEMHLHALERGLGEPHHCNSWSAQWASYLKALFKCGLIETVGNSKMVAPQAHARQNPCYRKL